MLICHICWFSRTRHRATIHHTNQRRDTQSLLVPTVNIQRCRWVWTLTKTIDRWLCPAASSDVVRNGAKKWTKGQVGACKSPRQRHTHAHAQKWHSVSTVPKDQRSQSTFIAVGGFNCVEELTERWMQLCPRFHPNVKRNSVPICWWWHYLFLRLSHPLRLPPTTGTHRRCELTGSSDCISITLAGAEGSKSGYSSRVWGKKI